MLHGRRGKAAWCVSCVRRAAVRCCVCRVERGVAAALVRVWQQLVCCVKCILLHCGSENQVSMKVCEFITFARQYTGDMCHKFLYSLVGFINIARHRCMAIKYLKLYSAFPFPFLGWMPSPLCLKREPLLCCNANRPEYNSATVAACICYRTCRRKERRRKC
jgi:hypothetical protein